MHQMQNHPGVLATKVRYIGVKSTKDEDKMVGTSYIDDTIWPRYAEAPTYCGCSVHTRLVVVRNYWRALGVGMTSSWCRGAAAWL